MRGLVTMMHGCVVVGGGLVMMLTRWMLRGVRHICYSMGINPLPQAKESGCRLNFSD